MDNLRSVCIKYRLPVDNDILENVLDYCDADCDGMISYLEFANFLNWKEKLPSGLDDLGCKFYIDKECCNIYLLFSMIRKVVKSFGTEQ